MELTKKKCVPCDKGTPALDRGQVHLLMGEVKGWEVLDDNRKLHKQYKFKDFRQALAFVVKMGMVAEAEDHHPDFTVHYNLVDVTLWTHTVGGLSENDFIVAAKVDQL